MVACAAALATLDVIEQEGLVANAAARGQQLLDGLRALQPRHPRLGDVRGLGAMVALEFVDPTARRSADARPGAWSSASWPRRSHASSSCCRPARWGQCVRIIPPLVTTSDEVDLALGIIGESLVAAGA